MGMESFAGKLAVVTGGGSGMGRELVRQLAAAGCSVAACDLNPDSVAVTAATAWAAAPPGVTVTGHTCDVSDEAQVLRFRDELLEQHASDHVDLVFSNAGVAGGSSFIKDSREEWERTFAINWWGVYFCARTFLPLLIASGAGVLVNISSVAGFWATAGPGAPPITAYCTSEFAIKGFSEALIPDLRANAPHVRVVVVMPGVVNTDIAANSRRALGLPDVEQLSDTQLLELIPDVARAVLIEMGLLPEDFSADDLRQAIPRLKDEFRDKGFTAAQAATIILDGVRSGAWRILVGEEAKMLDEQVRANPEAPFNYENYAEMYGPLIAQAQESGAPEP
jgi:NAD(P)-dependent dehydrogenase (short-subunit alcohol dehydrogenase family)